MSREMATLEEFLSHRASEKSGDFLKWREDGEVDVWLHTKVMPIALWQHRIPTVVVLDDRDSGEQVTRVWSRPYNCPEDEGILKKQYRTDDTGRRKFPPRTCPVCKLLNWLEVAVQERVIGWTQPFLQFEADDPEESIIIHAGGAYGSYREEDMDPDDKRMLKDEGISLRESFKENMMAKMSYLFAVCVNSAPEAGVQVAVETGGLGDEVKDVIEKAVKSLGRQGGDPFLNPYAIKWIYDKKQPRPDRKYSAVRMEQMPLTPAVAEVIRGPKPDLSGYLQPFDPVTMRTMLERHCTVRQLVPWDQIFAGAARPQATAADFPYGANAPAQSTMQTAQTTFRIPATQQQPSPPGVIDEDEIVGCDGCGKPMLAVAPQCPHCGKQYAVTTAAAPTPPPAPTMAKRRKRRSPGPANEAPGDVNEDNLPWGKGQ